LFFTMFARAGGAGYLASTLGGIVYAFSGMSAIGASSPQLGAAITWSPLLLWAVREYSHRFDAAAAVLAGVAGALLILSGAHAFALTAGAVAAAYAVQAVVFTSKSVAGIGQRTRGLLIMVGIAFGVSAVQWLATLAWVVRLESPFDYLWALPLEFPAPATAAELFTQVFASEPGESPRLAYLGIASLALIPAALLHRRRRRDTAFFVLAGLASVVFILFFGWRLPLHFPLPALVFPILLCAALLVSIAADRLFIPRRTFRSPTVWFPVTLVLVACAILFYAFGAEVRRYVMPLAAVVVVFAPARMRGLTALCLGMVGAVLFLDLVHANRTVYTHPRQDAPACYETYAQGLAIAREQALGGRVLASARELDRGLSGNFGMIASMNAVGGAELPLTGAQSAWWDRMAGHSTGPLRASGKDVTPQSPEPGLVEFMAARVLIATAQGALHSGRWQNGGPRLREVSPAGDIRVFVLDDALPRAYWAPRAQVEVGMPATLDALVNPSFDPVQVCVVDAQSPGIAGLANPTRSPRDTESAPASEATCSVADISPEHVVIRVDAVRDGVTVLADMDAPGWTATLDGNRQSILKVNGLFRGIATPAGPHVIEFRYRPWSVYLGIGISCLTLACVILGGIRALGRPSAARVPLL
ncbi:MAG: YfhO family protein, partial [Candidatus Hydrogenedentes bacterium]|nr:YfhO family protein [Candidatus Hydrogenedentota bacterium]